MFQSDLLLFITWNGSPFLADLPTGLGKSHSQVAPWKLFTGSGYQAKKSSAEDVLPCPQHLVRNKTKQSWTRDIPQFVEYLPNMQVLDLIPRIAQPRCGGAHL